MSTRVYSYGATRPTAQAEVVDEHYYRANRYRNDLTALEIKRRKQVEDAQRTYFPRIVELEAEIEPLEAEIEALRGGIRKGNSARRKRAVDKATKTAIDAIKVRRAAIYAELKAQRSAAFGPDELKELRKGMGKVREALKKETRKRDVTGHPRYIAAAEQVHRAEEVWFSAVPQAKAFRDALAAIEAAHATEAKRLRANCGVHWGTYLAIEQATEKFRQGAPPKFKRYRGDGKVGVQTMDGPVVRDLLGSDKGQLAIDGYDPDRDGKQQVNTRLRIGTDDSGKPTWAEIPTTVHRPIPQDARVKWAYLVRRRVGTHDHYRMQLTLDREDERWEKSDVAERGTVAVDVGWRMVKGGLRVAYWVGDDGREGELVLPDELMEMFGRAEELRSGRDLQFNLILPIAVEYVKRLIEAGMAPDWMIRRTHKEGKDGVTRFTMPQWRATAQLAALMLQWRENRIDGDECDLPLVPETRREMDRWRYAVSNGKPSCHTPLPGIYGLCEQWRAADKMAFDKESHGRNRAGVWRDEIYRVFAAWLRTEYRTCIVEDVNWREMQAIPQEAELDVDQHMVGRFHNAAVGKLVQTLTQSMRETVRGDPKRSTQTCPICHELSGEVNPARLYHTCANCAATYDQDHGAAINLLRSHLSPAVV